MAFLNSGPLSNPDPSLPVVTDFGPIIGNSETFGSSAWLVPDTARVTAVASRVSAVADRSTAAKGYAQAISGKQPLVVPNAINGRPALQFANSRNDRLDASAVVSVAGDFGLVGVVKPNTTATPRTIAVLGSISSQFARLYLGGGLAIAFQVGQSGAVTTAVRSAVDATDFLRPRILLAGWDSVGKIASISIDGGLTWGTGTNASTPQPVNGNLYLGTDDVNGATLAYDGLVADFDALAFNPANAANAAKLTSLLSYYSNRYYLPA